MESVRKILAPVLIVVSFILLIGVYAYLIKTPASRRGEEGYIAYEYISDPSKKKAGAGTEKIKRFSDIVSLLRPDKNALLMGGEIGVDKADEPLSKRAFTGYVYEIEKEAAPVVKKGSSGKYTGDVIFTLPNYNRKKPKEKVHIIAPRKIDANKKLVTGEFRGDVLQVVKPDSIVKKSPVKKFEGVIFTLNNPNKKARLHTPKIHVVVASKVYINPSAVDKSFMGNVLLIPKKSDPIIKKSDKKPFKASVLIVEEGPAKKHTSHKLEKEKQFKASVLIMEQPPKKTHLSSDIESDAKFKASVIIIRRPLEDEYVSSDAAKNVKFEGRILTTETENPAFRESELLVKDGKLKMAREVLLLKSKELPPLKLQLKLGDVSKNSGNFKEALEHYKKAEQVKPDDNRVARNISSIYMILGQPKKALKYSEKIEFDEVNKAEILLQDAALARFKGDKNWKKILKRADVVLGRVKEGNAPEIPAMKGKSAYLGGRTDEAAQYFVRAVSEGDLDEAYKVDIYLALAQIYITKGDLEKADAVLDRVIEITENWAPDSFEKARLHREFALLYKKVFLGKNVTGEEILSHKKFYQVLDEREIELPGSDPIDDVETLALLLSPGKTPKAELDKNLTKLKEIVKSPEYPLYFEDVVFHRPMREIMANVLEGDLYRHVGNEAKAQESYQRALKKSPKNKVILGRLKKPDGRN